MEDKKTPVFFPVLSDAGENAEFRKHTVALATAMCGAANDYLKALPDGITVNAFSIGAACWLASHLLGLELDSQSKEQVTKGLVATLALNTAPDLHDLATIPLNETKPN